MISTQIIKNTIEELKSITRIDFSVLDLDGNPVATTWNLSEEISADTVRQFSASLADSQEVKGYHFFKVFDDRTPEYVLIIKGSGENVHVMGKVAVSQLQGLIVAYKERFDKNNFIQNLILDNLLLVDIYNRAKKLHIEAEAKRIVYIVETRTEKDSTAMEIMKGLFGSDARDFITAVDEKSIILVQELEPEDTYEKVESTARMLCDMMNTEAMSSVRVSYGTMIQEIQQISRSYKEARMALNVGKIFYSEKWIHAYNTLGIGRLIYQLPLNLCEMFIHEIFTE